MLTLRGGASGLFGSWRWWSVDGIRNFPPSHHSQGVGPGCKSRPLDGRACTLGTSGSFWAGYSKTLVALQGGAPWNTSLGGVQSSYFQGPRNDEAIQEPKLGTTWEHPGLIPWLTLEFIKERKLGGVPGSGRCAHFLNAWKGNTFVL